jgi:hypothetical protein
MERDRDRALDAIFGGRATLDLKIRPPHRDRPRRVPLRQRHGSCSRIESRRSSSSRSQHCSRTWRLEVGIDCSSLTAKRLLPVPFVTVAFADLMSHNCPTRSAHKRAKPRMTYAEPTSAPPPAPTPAPMPVSEQPATPTNSRTVSKSAGNRFIFISPLLDAFYGVYKNSNSRVPIY